MYSKLKLLSLALELDSEQNEPGVKSKISIENQSAGDIPITIGELLLQQLQQLKQQEQQQDQLNFPYFTDQMSSLSTSPPSTTSTSTDGEDRKQMKPIMEGSGENILQVKVGAAATVGVAVSGGGPVEYDDSLKKKILKIVSCENVKSRRLKHKNRDGFYNGMRLYNRYFYMSSLPTIQEEEEEEDKK
ncbi:Hypothetical predicted protein [Octopus vulgaris]|uniref:Uncharacterized protein n=1 Tax=Octopus vulgaris TaxID=6645 RepID=A0AA36FHA2_OCTVU|nr:Hypothetical predicted protein [Octopus vulgaris]